MSDALNYLQLSRGELWQNAEAVCRFVGVPVIGVVKSDGYGVSITEAARAWQQSGVTMFAVSRPQEALVLRHAGFREDILLMAPVADAQTLNTLLSYKVILTITSLENAVFYSLYSSRQPIRVHVAVDTGMGRFGVRWEDIEQLRAIYRLAGFQFEGIFSHFSKSFEKEFRFTGLQLTRLLNAVSLLELEGHPVGMRHIANSSAALRFPQTRLDAVRIGSALVGRLPGKLPVALHSAGTFRAQVVECKTFRPGDTTGYASVCRIKRHTRAVVVAVGREDGFGYFESPGAFGIRDMAWYLYHLLLRCLRRPWVEFQGKRLPMIGRIGQQYTLFDAGSWDIQPGDYVSVEVPLLFPRHSRRICSESGTLREHKTA